MNSINFYWIVGAIGWILFVFMIPGGLMVVNGVVHMGNLVGIAIWFSQLTWWKAAIAIAIGLILQCLHPIGIPKE